MIRALPCVESVITPAWDPVNERASQAEVGDRHGQQRHRDPLARGEQHVQLAARGQRADLRGQVEEFVGGVAHGGHHHDDGMPGLAGRDDALRHPLDAVGVGHRGSTVLLHDKRHR